MHEKQSINAQWHLGMRPKCRCCGGGEHRKGYKHTKAASAYQTRKHLRAKPKGKRPTRGDSQCN